MSFFFADFQLYKEKLIFNGNKNFIIALISFEGIRFQTGLISQV